MKLRGLAADRNLVIVCGLVASTQMAWGVVVPVLPLYAQDFGASDAELGLIISLFGLGRLLVNLPAGRLAERVDQRRLLLASVFATVLCMFGTGLVTDLHQLFVLRFVTGLAGGFAITVGNAFVASSSKPATRGASMGLLHSFQLAGGALGPSFGGLVVSVWGMRAAFWCSGLVAVVFLVWGAFRLATPEWVGSPERLDEAPTPRLVTDDLLERPTRGEWLLRDPSFLAVCVVGFVVFFGRFGGQQFLVPILAYDAGMSVGQLGLALGAVTTVNILMVGFAIRLGDQVGRKTVISVAVTLAATLSLGYIWADQAIVMLALLFVVGMLNSFSGPAPVAYLADVSPPARYGSAVGIYRTFGDMAALLGPLSLGWLLDTFGMSPTVVVLAAVGAAGGLWFAAFARADAFAADHVEPVAPVEPARATTQLADRDIGLVR